MERENDKHEIMNQMDIYIYYVEHMAYGIYINQSICKHLW